MSISTPLGPPQGAIVSCDTALACLGLLSIQYGVDAEIGSDRDTLPLSRVIELAVGFGFEAQHVHGDWQWLQRAVNRHPVLLLLKNTNVVVAVGSRLGLPEEIVVSDPLYRDGEILILPREDLERAWDGQALIITPLARWDEISSRERTLEVPDQPSQRVSPLEAVTRPVRRLVVGPGMKRVTGVAFGLVCATLIATGLLTDWSTEEVRSSTVPAGEALSNAVQAAVPIGDVAVLPSITADGLADVMLPLPPESPPIRRVLIPSEPDPPAASAPAAPTILPAGAVLPPEPVSTAAVVPLTATPGRVEVEPPTEPVPAWTSLSTAEIAALLAQADKHLGGGDVASARLFYERAANAREAIAALRMGETFDPMFLGFAHLGGVPGNLETAVSWYRRARDLGSGEAAILLQKLEAK